MKINSIFESLSATSSRLEKEKILREIPNNRDGAIFKSVLTLALDPFKQFYIRKIPKYQTPSFGNKRSLVWGLEELGELSSRRKTGNAGIEHLKYVLESLTEDDAKVIERVIKKDLDCGVQASTVNKIWKNLIHEYPCMLCSPYEQKLVDKVKFPAFAQLKLDGMRFNAIVKLDTVEYRSRNGKEIYVQNPILDAAFVELASNVGMAEVVFDGELLVVDASGKKYLDRKTGNGILNKAVKGTISPEESINIRATIWDIIPLQNFEDGVCNVGYSDRYSTIVAGLDNLSGSVAHMIDLAATREVSSVDDAKKVFEKYLADGQEGIILKTMNGIWENKRTKSQIKFKGVYDCDLLCVKWEEGTGKYSGVLGSLALESSDGKVKVSVGTGLNDTMRKSLTPKDVEGKVVAVKYNARITSRDRDSDSLFLPVFVEIREDKTDADSSDDIK